MDIQLPGIDGLTLIKQIKASVVTKDIPIIAVTAYAMKGDEQKILDTGCNAYVSKPINTQELPLIVEKYIKKHEQGKNISSRRYQTKCEITPSYPDRV